MAHPLVDKILNMTIVMEGGRKFTVAIWATILSFAGLMVGKLSGAEFVQALQYVLLFFGAANVGEHFGKRGQDAPQE